MKELCNRLSIFLAAERRIFLRVVESSFITSSNNVVLMEVVLNVSIGREIGDSPTVQRRATFSQIRFDSQYRAINFRSEEFSASEKIVEMKFAVIIFSDTGNATTFFWFRDTPEDFPK